MRSILTSVVVTTLLSTAAACATAGPRDGGAQDAVLVAPTGEALALAPIVGTHDATVLVWWASTCPCVKRYEARVRDLAARLGSERAAFYYVASNADDGPERVAAAGAHAPLPILRDEGGELARRLGVVSTPTVVVLDRTGRVRFQGWLDNEHVPGDPDREPWLEETLDRLLAGGDADRRTPTWGCMVTRSLGQVGRCHGAVATPAGSP